MSRPKLLDLSVCQGGAGMGYHRAGFDVVGVDVEPQPRYPFEFHQGDALKFFLENWHEFDAFHASPPCQAFTLAQRIQGNEHADYLRAVETMFRLVGRPWVIENVEGAPLFNPVTLCGAMFGLSTYRHRLFKSNIALEAPEHPPHIAATTKMGRPPRDGEFMHIVGNFSGVQRAREVMGMEWATRDGLREAIPPAYTEHIGAHVREWLTSEAVVLTSAEEVWEDEPTVAELDLARALLTAAAAAGVV